MVCHNLLLCLCVKCIVYLCVELSRLDSVVKLNCVTFEPNTHVDYRSDIYPNWLWIITQKSALDIFMWMFVCAFMSFLVTKGQFHFYERNLRTFVLLTRHWKMEMEFSLFSLVYTCVPSSHFTRVDSDDLHSLLSSRFPPHMVPPHHSLHTTGIPHPAIVTPNVKQESSHSDISSLNSSWVDFRCR